MFELMLIFLVILFFCTSRTKKGLKKGVSDTIETSVFLILKGNEAARQELSPDFDGEFEKLLAKGVNNEKR